MTDENNKEYKIIPNKTLLDALVESGLISNRKEAKRLAEQGAISWAGISNPDFVMTEEMDGMTLKIGDKYLKLRMKKDE